MKSYEINSQKHLLEPLINNAILDSVKWIHQRCVPQEPDYIASLSVNFTRNLINILKAVFPSYEFSITSVYCHQKPIVDIGLEKNPELGDLLFVYVERDSGHMRLNSLLLQAKISKSNMFKVHNNEMHQLRLYQEWPKFKYLRAGHLNGHTRNIVPKTINDGAQYLLIDNSPLTNGLYGIAGTYPMGCATPAEILNINNGLAPELIDFMKFKSGRAFENLSNNCEDDWSRMIWDLLYIAGAKYTKRKNAGLDSFPRSSGDSCIHYCSSEWYKRTFIEELQENAARYSEKNQFQFISDENSGIPVVIIESAFNRDAE